MSSVSFFYHVATYGAISQGWDFEQGMNSFYKRQPEEFLNSPVYSIRGVDVTEFDVFKASEGEYTDNLKSFVKEVYTDLGDKDPKKVILQSSHSGSSDRWYVKDMVDLYNKLFKHQE